MTEDPLVIGGTGGSGTRVVARVAAAAGWFLGARRNGSDDALDIADFDWRWGPEHVRSGSATAAMHAAFDDALAAHLATAPPDLRRWGWKHPQSYLLLPFLADRFPGLRFIHVVRDGRDVAFGRIHNQVALYGDHALGPGDPADPVRRVAFWAWANERAHEHCLALLPERWLCVRLEDLCADPAAGVRRILRFLGADVDPAPVDLVARPDTLGAGRRAGAELIARWDAAAGATLRRFGYLGFAALAAEVAADPALQDRLRAQRDWPAFAEVALAVAGERACGLTADELAEARGRARRAWIERAA